MNDLFFFIILKFYSNLFKFIDLTWNYFKVNLIRLLCRTLKIPSPTFFNSQNDIVPVCPTPEAVSNFPPLNICLEQQRRQKCTSVLPRFTFPISKWNIGRGNFDFFFRVRHWRGGVCGGTVASYGPSTVQSSASGRMVTCRIVGIDPIRRILS